MKTKDQVQREAINALDANSGSGIVTMATGTGKSKIPIMIAQRDLTSTYKILICVPTEKLRDENWKKEFEKWEANDIWHTHVERTCYVSMPKILDQIYDMVIMDECHNITEYNIQFFTQNKCKRIIGLTATMPENLIKLDLLKSLRLKIVYSVSMDQAVKWKLVSPYRIILVRQPMNTIQKTVKAGNKLKPFYQTEYEAYAYVTKKINQFATRQQQGDILTSQDLAIKEILIRQRMHLVYNFESKLNTAKFLLEYVIHKDQRTLIFAGSIKHADELCIDSFHSKSSKHSTTFERFNNKQINRLSCVNSLNEGHNIPDLDNALIVQLNSKSLRMIQRIGRIVRYREDHIATIFIITTKDTVDENWTKSSLKEFDEDNIINIDFTYLKQHMDEFKF